MQRTETEPLVGALLRMPIDVITRRLLDALRANGIDDIVPAHFVVLRYPGPDGKRPSDLAGEANMSRQAMNYLLGQLEQLGYVERRDDRDDGRSKRVYETERGAVARNVMRDAMRALEAEWSAQLGERSFEQLRGLLLRLNEITHGAAPLKS